MSQCKIEIQNVAMGRHAVPQWWCQTHAMPCGPTDKQCQLGRIEEAADCAVARVDIELGRMAAEKAEAIKKALKL